jgi:hypothetical protein
MSINKRIDEAVRLRNRAYMAMDLAFFRAAIIDGDYPGPSSDTVLMASIHKARYECTGIPDKYRHESRAWLEQQGLTRYRGAPWPPTGVLEK